MRELTSYQYSKRLRKEESPFYYRDDHTCDFCGAMGIWTREDTMIHMRTEGKTKHGNICAKCNRFWHSSSICLANSVDDVDQKAQKMFQKIEKKMANKKPKKTIPPKVVTNAIHLLEVKEE